MASTVIKWWQKIHGRGAIIIAITAVPANALATIAGDPITTIGGDYITVIS